MKISDWIFIVFRHIWVQFWAYLRPLHFFGIAPLKLSTIVYCSIASGPSNIIQCQSSLNKTYHLIWMSTYSNLHKQIKLYWLQSLGVANLAEHCRLTSSSDSVAPKTTLTVKILLEVTTPPPTRRRCHKQEMATAFSNFQPNSTYNTHPSWCPYRANYNQPYYNKQLPRKEPQLYKIWKFPE